MADPDGGIDPQDAGELEAAWDRTDPGWRERYAQGLPSDRAELEAMVVRTRRATHSMVVAAAAGNLGTEGVSAGQAAGFVAQNVLKMLGGPPA